MWAVWGLLRSRLLLAPAAFGAGTLYGHLRWPRTVFVTESPTVSPDEVEQCMKEIHQCQANLQLSTQKLECAFLLQEMPPMHELRQTMVTHLWEHKELADHQKKLMKMFPQGKHLIYVLK